MQITKFLFRAMSVEVEVVGDTIYNTGINNFLRDQKQRKKAKSNVSLSLKRKLRHKTEKN